MGGSFFALIVGFSWYSWLIGFFAIRSGWNNPFTGKLIVVADIVLTYQAMIFGMFTILGILGLIPAVTKALATGREVMDVIERVPEIRNSEAEKLVTKIEINDGIKFNNVAFRYPTAPASAKNVFDDATFTIKAGTSTAIVGPSGSGKSTIVQMLNRFYDPLAGTIRYGATDLKEIDLTTLRESIGWVGQEPVLVVGTIRENLQYGNKDASAGDVDRALRQANATFIEQLEKGLDTYVGSGTVLNLSGGQKQRIAIARALLKRPQILVLDEATSALDPKSEAEVQNAIMNIQHEQRGHLTIIMIAHRLTTVKNCDRICLLEHGRVSASGAFEELTQQSDTFREMARDV